MKTAVIYKSYFRTTEQYARWLGEALGADIVPVKKADDLARYDRVIVMSGTYAGKMPLVGFLKKHWAGLRDKDVIVVAVGAAPEDDPASKISYEQIPDEIRAKIAYFKIRGATPFADKEKREHEISKAELDRVIEYVQRRP